MKILVIEDDRMVGTLIRHVLEIEHHEVTVADRACSGEKIALQKGFEIIILDLALPDKNGLEVCKTLRSNNIKTPILILSAYHDTTTKIAGLNTGADDYLTKPFDNMELLARINAIRRRVGEGSEINNIFKCGQLKIDLVNREFQVCDKHVTLTNYEFNLMAHFMKNPDRIIQKDELTRRVWNIRFDTNTNFLNVHISFIRKKIGDITPLNYIQTVRKKGFKLNSNPVT